MTRTLPLALAAAVMTGPFGLAHEPPASDTVTWTGWFSDLGCAAGPVANGRIGPNNPDCVKSCLDKGATPVFISEQARDLFTVTDHAAVTDDVGYHVEVTGRVDPGAKRIAVTSVKRLAWVGAQCALPKKSGGRQ